jgi:hypothetical protein
VEEKERGPKPRFRLDTERFKQEVAEEIQASLRERTGRRERQSEQQEGR